MISKELQNLIVENFSHNQQGLFITFEGGEGCGKSTLSKKLTQTLNEVLPPITQQAIWTREPGGSVDAERIRDVLVNGEADRWTPYAEAMLMFAARSSHIEQTIRPHLTQGTWVICDRFVDSSYVYQGFCKGVDAHFLDKLTLRTVGGLFPQRTYLLDLPPMVGLKRVDERLKTLQGNEQLENRFENLDMHFHEQVRNGFLSRAKLFPDRFVILDATQDIDTLYNAIINDLIAFIKRIKM